ncbi:uncharacterized protein LOC144877059 isoform X2 [Branchiostoma floridae x Branchiostoma japonicum]
MGYNGRVVSRVGAALAICGGLSVVFITGCLGLTSGKQPTNKGAMAGFLSLTTISIIHQPGAVGPVRWGARLGEAQLVLLLVSDVRPVQCLGVKWNSRIYHFSLPLNTQLILLF